MWKISIIKRLCSHLWLIFCLYLFLNMYHGRTIVFLLHILWYKYTAAIQYHGISIWYRHFTVVPERDSISHKVFITENVSVIKMTNTALIVFYERRCARSSRAGGKNRRAEERESCVVKVSPETSLVLDVFDLPTVITFTSKRASSLRLQTCTWTHSHTHINIHL